MITTFDHVIVLAEDIEQCALAFEKAGFAVTNREDEGDHVAEHRLVCLPDGSYLELYSFHRELDAAQEHRWFPYAEKGGEGFCDYSVTTSDMPAVLAAADAAGVPHTAMGQGGKKRLDGEEWLLQLSMFGLGISGPELPFVLADVTPRSVRVNGTEPHPNGAQAIVSVTVATRNPDSARAGLSVLTGSEPAESQSPEGRLLTYAFGDRSIRLLVPAEGSAAAARVAQVGPVVYEIQVSTSGPDKGLIAPETVNRARIVLV
jgi:hypothetical protein